jgi:hypothetical protein
VLLRGNLKEFSLPNILQLVNMSARSGALTIRRDNQWGRIYFRKGLICHAFSVPQYLPLGERLVRDGAITAEQLRRALTAQEDGAESVRIGGSLLAEGVLDRATLERAVREQIQGAAFDFFGWEDGAFEFGVDDQVTDEDILVEMHVESVIMEGCRRIDEWERFVESIGSMERIPHLTFSPEVAELGEIVLTTEQWRAIVHTDGRADINTILRDSGLDRFHGAKVMHSLHSRGLISVCEPVIQNIGRTFSVAVRGPIDIYNEVFLTTLTDGGVVRQLRVEIIDDKETEIPVLAGRVALDGGPDEDGILVFTAPTSAPDEAWLRVAGKANAWVVLANANDIDSLRSTRLDLEFVRGLGRRPLVVGSYVSMADDEFSPAQVAEILGLDADVPVVPFHLRDRESVVAVVRGVLQSAAV